MIEALCCFGVSQMAQITVATLERRVVRAEMALSQAKAQARKESKVSREENEALGRVIDRLEGVLLAQQVFLPGLCMGTGGTMAKLCYTILESTLRILVSTLTLAFFL